MNSTDYKSLVSLILKEVLTGPANAAFSAFGMTMYDNDNDLKRRIFLWHATHLQIHSDDILLIQ